MKQYGISLCDQGRQDIIIRKQNMTPNCNFGPLEVKYTLTQHTALWIHNRNNSTVIIQIIQLVIQLVIYVFFIFLYLLNSLFRVNE